MVQSRNLQEKWEEIDNHLEIHYDVDRIALEKFQ